MQVPSLLQAAPFKDRTFTFALTPKLYERIAELAQVSKLSQAEVARRLIEDSILRIDQEAGGE